MALETKLLIGCFVVLASGLVLAVTRVLGAWTEHHVSRHDLIVASRQQRMNYLRSVAEREEAYSGAENSSVIIEDDDFVEEEEFAQAA